MTFSSVVELCVALGAGQFGAILFVYYLVSRVTGLIASLHFARILVVERRLLP